MALDRATVSVPFVGGVETKTDEKTVLPGKLVLLENGEFTKHGTVRKRPGSVALTDVPVDGTKILNETSTALLGTKRGLVTRGDELLLATTDRMYAADSATSRWQLRSVYHPNVTTTTEVAFVPAAQTYPSIATSGVLQVVTWADSRGGVRYSVYNRTTGAAYVQDSVLASSNATLPVAVPLGSTIVVAYVDTANDAIKGKIIKGTDILASIADAVITLVDDLEASELYAVTSDDTYMYLAYKSDGSIVSTGVALAKINAAGTTIFKVSVGTTIPTCIDVAYSVAEAKANVCWYDGTSVFSREYTASSGAPVAAATTVETVANVVKVATGSSYTGSLTTGFSYAYEVSAATADLHTVTVENELTGTFTVQHAHLISSGFQINQRCHFILGHDSRTGLQNSYYLYNDLGILWGQLLYQTAADRGALTTLSRVWLRDDTDFETALGFKRALDAEGTNAVFSHQGIKHAVIDSASKVNHAEAGNTAYISGSMLWAYDGAGLAEANLLMYPDVIGGTATGTMFAESNSSGTLTAVNQYSYRVYYVVHRANGERVRSAALTASFTLTGANDTLTLTIPTLAHTRYRDDYSATYLPEERHGDVVIEVYRTIGNDTTGLYYKVSGNDPAVVTGNNRFVYNDPTATTVEFIDWLPDTGATAITQYEVDYLSRGEIEHISTPGPALVAAVGDRLFVAGGGVPANTIRYSKLRFVGEPAEFSDLLVIDDVPEVGGDITALSYINESLVAFKEHGVVTILGPGADNTGSSGGFTSQAVTSDLGCTGTTAVMPQGVMFHSPKGVHLLDQSFAISYIGSPVELYNSQTYTSALVIPGTNQVVFYTTDSRTIMYDYVFGQWSTWTGNAATDAVVWNDTVAWLRSADSLVLYRSSTVYTDGGASVVLKMRTAPVRLKDELQNFAKMRRFAVLGTYASPHRLRVGLYYDRDEAPFEEFIWDPSSVIDTSTWGSDATWGSGALWGGIANPRDYQFEHRPKRSKFATIRFEFTEIPGNPVGAGFELTEVALECGIKPGLQRHAAARKY